MKILILCQFAASSMVLVKRMREAAQSKSDIKVEVESKDVTSLQDINLGEYDVILLAPQVRHYRKEVERRTKDLNLVIDTLAMTTYGLGDGAKALQQAVELARQSGIDLSESD